ncbi:hypothetical protein Psch_01240 [Pelotomaculum schinkii]|uniref:Uncharacterized protein n=1 Tax=Pelotomaculum schinkii TaxID=78350 RepID=A0A4Y7RFA8_9FIRM|nr:hypothetical protein [Pelotomaculum schinkii]TEB07685.1 hypothetical protein Psch_01240 [Pelotomaculum schinkii]
MNAAAIHPLQNPAYFHSLKILSIGIIISLAIFVFLVVISILKPWGKRKLAQGNGSPRDQSEALA